jgi:carboxypeptidase family protein
VPSRVLRIVALRQAMSAALGLTLLAWPGCTLASQAQADAKTGSLQIDVVDPSGAAIARAKIQIQLRPQGPVQKFSADQSGKLSMDLQPGGYDVLVSSPGFRQEAREVKLEEASRQELSVTLEVESYSWPKVLVDPAYAAQLAARIGIIDIGIKDQAGGWMDGVRVGLRVLPDGPVLNALTVHDGTLTVPLSRGSYELTFSELGFKNTTRRVDVRGGDTQSLDVVMEIQPCTDCLRVYGAPAIATTPEPLPKLIGGCTGQEQIAELQPTDPAYADATAVEDQLDGLGIMVRCTCASKWARLFRGEVGAAWFRSDDGIFEVLFLPKGQTFAHLKVLEHRDGDRYLTSFTGKPYSAVHMDGSKPTYFVKRGNRLYSVWGDEKLAALLESRLPK